MILRFLSRFWTAFLTLLLIVISTSSIYAADTLRVLAIRVQFVADSDESTTGDGTFDLRVDNEPYRIDPAPHDRAYFQDHLKFLKNYYLKITNQQLVIEGDVFPIGRNDAYQLSETMGYYNPNSTEEEINRGLARLLRDGIELADQDPAIDFSLYDSYILFHAGVGRDIDVGLDDTPQDIPSLFITSEFLQTYLGQDGIPVDGNTQVVPNGILLPETESQEGIELGLNGMLVSNFGSQLGWLDLFSPETGRSGVGRFGVMDAGLFNGDGLVPPVPMAWTRVSNGYAPATTISQAQGDEFTIHAAGTGGIEIYKVPINPNEYFLIENRYSGGLSLDSLQAVMSDQVNELVSMREVLETHLPDAVTFSDSTGVLVDIDNLDRGLPGSGILIWHIDEQVINANRATNRINADPDLRGVDLEEADGSQDIGEDFEIISGGAGSEIGYALDFWFADNGTPVFEEDPAGTFAVNSIPGSYSNYNRANSHVTISNFSRRGPVMTFMVDNNFFQPGFPRQFDTAVYGRPLSLKAFDVDGVPGAEAIVTTDQNKILAFNASGQLIVLDDSLALATLPDAIVGTPAQLIPSNVGLGSVIVTTTAGGKVYGLTVTTATSRLDTVFSFDIGGQVTTFPTTRSAIEKNSQQNYSVAFGGADGNVYAITENLGVFELSSLFSIGEAVEAIQPLQSGSFLVVGASGNIYRDASLEQQLNASVSQPVGLNGAVILNNDEVKTLSELTFSQSTAGNFQFDSPVITIGEMNETTENLQEKYVVAGGNNLYMFNENLSLVTDFPVAMYSDRDDASLTASPIAGSLGKENNVNRRGIVFTDPAGVISAVYPDGKPVADFPLSVGDSIAGAPALTDLDADGDIELMVATRSGQILAYDLSGDALLPDLWTQENGDPFNRNATQVFLTFGGDNQTELLPENSAYNWPNPNVENHTYIRYRLNGPADVSLRIFDLAGDFVTELDAPQVPYSDNEVRWDLTDIQSGVYFARIAAEGRSENAVTIVKIAVIK